MWNAQEIRALACGATAAAAMGVLTGAALRVPRPPAPVAAPSLDFSQVNGPPLWPTDGVASLVPPAPIPAESDAMAAVSVPKEEVALQDEDLAPAEAEVERVSTDGPTGHYAEEATTPEPAPVQPDAEPAPDRIGGAQATALPESPPAAGARLLTNP
jgi:hypothetical protein